MIEKKICISCRLEINSDALFCSKCGIKQDREDIDISINRLKIPYSPLEVDEVLRVSLESDNDLLNKIYGAFSGVEFEEFKYSLLEARFRDIPFTNTLKKRIEKRYHEFNSEQLVKDFLIIKNSILSEIESKLLELENDKVIDVASSANEELIEELLKMGDSPSFYSAKYVLLEMDCREMDEFTRLSKQVHFIEYIDELKQDFQILKSANNLAIDLKKTNKRLDKFELGQKLSEQNAILKNETETLEEPLVNLEPEITDFVESNGDFKIIGIMILIFLGFVFYIITKSSGSEKSKSQGIKTETSSSCGPGDASCENSVVSHINGINGVEVSFISYIQRNDGTPSGKFTVTLLKQDERGINPFSTTVSVDCNCRVIDVGRIFSR